MILATWMSNSKSVQKVPFLATVVVCNDDPIVMITNIDGALITYTELTGNNKGSLHIGVEEKYDIYNGELTLKNKEVE